MSAGCGSERIEEKMIGLFGLCIMDMWGRVTAFRDKVQTVLHFWRYEVGMVSGLWRNEVGVLL